jgi:hypothetical protein
MPAAEDVGSMKVEYGVEVKQALNHLNDMGRYLEMVAAAAEANAEAVDRMSESVGGDLEKATSKYEKYAAATEDYLKKVKHGWLVVTAAAMGMMYGLIRASSYGSIYMKQFGAATRMLADKIMEDSGLSDTIQMLAENFMDFTDKIDKEGYFDAIISEIEDFVRWWDTVDWKLKAVIITVGLVAAAFTVLASAIALVKIGAFISAGWLALGTIFTWIAGTAVGGWLIATLTTIGATLATVGTALAGLISLSGLVAVALIALAAAVVYLWSKTEYGQKVIGDLILAWETFKESWSEIGFIGALGEAFGNLLEWFKADKWIRTGSPIDNFLVWIKDGFNSLISGALPWGKTFVTNLVDGISSKISWLYSVMVDVYDTVKDKIWALIVAAFPWGSTVLSDFIAGVRSWLGSLSSTAIDIYNTISSKIYDLIAVAWSWGSNFLSELVAGVKSWMNKWFNVGVDIYNTISTAIWDAVSGAWGWGANFVSNLVDGVKGKLPTFDSIFDTKIPKTIEDGMDTSARKTRDGGKKIIEEFEGMDRLIETDMDGMFSHWDTSVGNMDTGDTLERLYEAFHGTGTELEAIFTKLFVSWNDHIDNMNTDITSRLISRRTGQTIGITEVAGATEGTMLPAGLLDGLPGVHGQTEGAVGQTHGITEVAGATEGTMLPAGRLAGQLVLSEGM